MVWNGVGTSVLLSVLNPTWLVPSRKITANGKPGVSLSGAVGIRGQAFVSATASRGERRRTKVTLSGLWSFVSDPSRVARCRNGHKTLAHTCRKVRTFERVFHCHQQVSNHRKFYVLQVLF